MNASGPSIIARSASVIGREHVRIGKNNQDGWAVVQREGHTVGVIADGCSSQPCSEVGARLATQFWAEWVSQQFNENSGDLAANAMTALVEWVRETAQRLVMGSTRLEDVIEKYFLFTVQCAVVTPGRTLVFGQGDGVVSVDGRVTQLDSGVSNAPEYPAYWALSREPARATVHADGPAQVCVLATDGLNSHGSTLNHLATDPLVWSNPAHLQRKLNVFAAQERLGDDATVLMLRVPELRS